MVAKADTSQSVKVRYFALLKEERGLSEETIETSAATLRDLYQELQARHHFALGIDQLRVAVGDNFVDFDWKIQDQNVIIFVPPVAGG
ncbi:MAG: MoaD/ThiS family protein [Cyanobacteria bacterium SZAS TMP-1]|nr:MoaD/ThiS family protein [Cyanobacteria bacterium SZAS TMP-1]